MDLLELYELLRKGRRTLLYFVLAGFSVGLALAFLLPEKFQASALLEPATVVKKERQEIFSKTSVEPITALVEKMKLPTYYSSETLMACGLHKHPNPGKEMASLLRTNVHRETQYINVEIKRSSPALAKACLEAILQDVKSDQARLSKPYIDNLVVELSTAEQELSSATTIRDQQREKNKEKLTVTKSKLEAAKEFVDKFADNSLTFNFKDPQFSASALLVSTLIGKQNEIKDLEIQINSLEMEIEANITDKDQAVRRMTNIVNELRNALSYPYTKDASFVSPIYAPDTLSEPKRNLLIALGMAVGLIMGFLMLIAMNTRKKIK